MAITKTKFINYIRCPRYCALDEIKKEELNADITLEQYKEEEYLEKKQELINDMYDEDTDLIDVVNPQLEIMMPYYNKVEQLAGKYVETLFGGDTVFSENTYNQKEYECNFDGIKYLCYVDIYNESDYKNIIEVKATTTKKFLDIGKSYRENGKIKYNSIFIKDQNGILRLKGELENYLFDEDLDEKTYKSHLAKLFDKYNAAGHYVYDLAVQRYIIENNLKEENRLDEINNYKFYLAVLNSDYIFDGTYENEEPKYKDIISLIDLTEVTKDCMDKIDLDRQRVKEYVFEKEAGPCPLGNFCELKKTTKCKFVPVCYKNLPEKNSILSYIDNHHGFKDPDGYKHDRYDLISEGKVNMLDIPEEWLTRKTNQIQRKVVESDSTYIDLEKIKKGIENIEYPIYHLDFETFPCPLPRFNGEKPYSQSVFQFSLHIEKKPGECNKETNHYEYLAKDHNDNREEIIKRLIEYIPAGKGTVLVYNEAFEKGRLKELGEIFPEYKNQLKKISDMIFDLMYIVKTKSSLYEELGFEKDRAKLFNYYHKEMSGSFSIKKILPRFSDLSYKDLEVANGMEALITYANYSNMTKEELIKQTNNLIEYCKQDTWAMVVILWGLRELVKD